MSDISSLIERLDEAQEEYPFVLEDALYNEVRKALQSHEWQDISTAPKDGFHIQLYRPEIQFVGYWADAGWCMQGCKLIDPEPTHWQPLPQPPGDKDE